MNEPTKDKWTELVSLVASDAARTFGSEIGTLGSKEPPKSGNLRQQVVAFSLRPDAVGAGAYSSMIRDPSCGGSDPVLPQRKGVPSLIFDGDELRRFIDMSYETRVRLATYDFTSKLLLEGSPADRQNGKLGEVKISDIGGGLGLTLSGPDRGEVKQAIGGVFQLMVEARPRYIESAAQADFLELVFALDLGLLRPANLQALILDGKYDWTFQVIDTVTSVLATPLYYAKQMLAVERPSAIGIDIGHGFPKVNLVPVLPEPRHASFPSGHAAAAHAIATVLNCLCQPNGNRFAKLAARIGQNREVVGLHTNLDTHAGCKLGEAIAAWMADKGEKPSADFPWWSVMYAKAAAEWFSDSATTPQALAA